MKSYLRNAGLALGISLLWFIGGYIFAGAISVGFLEGGFFSPFAFQGAWVNVLIGGITMAIITATERGRRLFYDGVSDRRGLTGLKILLFFLLALPFLCATIGIVWLVESLLARLFDLWKL